MTDHVNHHGAGQDQHVILAVGDVKTYPTGHIPGARFITTDDLAAPMDHQNMKPTDLMLEMPDAVRPGGAAGLPATGGASVPSTAAATSAPAATPSSMVEVRRSGARSAPAEK